jgi:hypothetical protein
MGLLENACGFPSDSLALTDKVSISLAVLSTNTVLFESLDKVRIFSANPFWPVKEQPHKVDFGNLGGATYVRQYLPPGQCYLVYVTSIHSEYSVEYLEDRLKHPFRSLFIGQSDSLVVVDHVEIANLTEGTSRAINSWIPVTKETLPEDLRQVRGRVPLRFHRVLKSPRRQFSRDDILIAVGFGEPVRLKQPVACFKDNDRSVAFVPAVNIRQG